MGKEIWKSVIGYEDLYVVSNLGNVKSLDRTTVSKNNKTYRFNGKMLKTFFNGNKYLSVGLTRNSKTKLIRVYRLVAKAFIDNPDNKRCVNHKNGNKQDNTVNNLEWCTHKENINHALKNNLQSQGESHSISKLKANDVREIRRLAKLGVLQKDLARIYNTVSTNISSIVLIKSWRFLDHINKE